MSLVRPFAGLRPNVGRAGDVISPPYDVMSAAEARAMVIGRPQSFLHISRPEVDLPPDCNPYSAEVYAKAAENLQRMRSEGLLVQDSQPCFYVYRLTMGSHRQIGLVAAASVAAYDSGRIKRHEFTRPAKEDDRVKQIEALNAQTGPVFLVYRAHSAVDQCLARVAESPVEVDVVAADGVRHELWTIDAPQDLAFLEQSMDSMEALYVADGHHRSAAASRVAAARRLHEHEQESDYFLSVIFPHDQMKILPYNRVIRDLNGLTVDVFLARVREIFEVHPVEKAVQPEGPAIFGMYLAGQWYRLMLDPDSVPADPVKRLDVSLLADRLITPLLAITDPRRDDRIDFVGGIRGLSELMKRVDSGEMAVAFSLFATSMEDLMSVADAGEVMPPKSTWFEPKLADGLVSHLLDG